MARPAQRNFRLNATRRDAALLLVLCLASGVGLGFRARGRTRWIGRVPPVDERRVAAARERIDPNTAPVASLRRLQRIGPAIAKAIVAYRRLHGPRAFATAGDLQRVKGIGPKTVRIVAPDLTLPVQDD